MVIGVWGSWPSIMKTLEVLPFFSCILKRMEDTVLTLSLVFPEFNCFFNPTPDMQQYCNTSRKILKCISVGKNYLYPSPYTSVKKRGLNVHFKKWLDSNSPRTVGALEILKNFPEKMVNHFEKTQVCLLIKPVGSRNCGNQNWFSIQKIMGGCRYMNAGFNFYACEKYTKCMSIGW